MNSVIYVQRVKIKRRLFGAFTNFYKMNPQRNRGIVDIIKGTVFQEYTQPLRARFTPKTYDIGGRVAPCLTNILILCTVIPNLCPFTLWVSNYFFIFFYYFCIFK